MILDYNLWWKEGKLYLFFLLLILLWGFWGLNPNKWHNWEEASIFLTLILTGIVYREGFWGSKKFDSFPSEKIGTTVILIVLIFLFSLPLISNTLHHYFPKLPVAFEIPRCIIMSIILLISIILSWIDYQIGKEDDIFMIKIFYFSDLPIIVTFALLLIYSFIVNSNATIEPLFSGAIAFQMSLSIFLASIFSHQDIIKIITINYHSK